MLQGILRNLKYALVWGSSTKHRPQKVNIACTGLSCNLVGCRWPVLRGGLLDQNSHSWRCGCLQVGKDHVLQDEDIVQLVKKV